jgi:hypothetical protein
MPKQKLGWAGCLSRFHGCHEPSFDYLCSKFKVHARKKYLRQFSVSINLECGSVEILFDFKFNFIHAYDDIKTYLILMSLTYNDLELLLFNYMLLIMVVVKQ